MDKVDFIEFCLVVVMFIAIGYIATILDEPISVSRFNVGGSF